MTTIRNWFAADTYLGRKSDRPVANNTRVHRLDDERIAIKLHDTDVVVYDRDGTVELFTGGWLTPTTKDRINTFSRARVGSDRGRWYIYGPSWDRGTRQPFFEGVRLREGTVLNPLPTARIDARVKAEDKMRKRIDEYVKGYMQALIDGMPKPSNGDCWDCMFQTEDGRSLGDTKDDQIHGHLFQHMVERYYVPSLIWNAVKAKGYLDPSVIMGTRLDINAYEQGTMRIRNGWGKDEPDKYVVNDMRRELRKYLVKRLIPTMAH